MYLLLMLLKPFKVVCNFEITRHCRVGKNKNYFAWEQTLSVYNNFPPCYKELKITTMPERDLIPL